MQKVRLRYSENEVQKNNLRNVSDYWWLFECNMYCVMALGWLKKRRKEEDEQFSMLRYELRLYNMY